MSYIKIIWPGLLAALLGTLIEKCSPLLWERVFLELPKKSLAGLLVLTLVVTAFQFGYIYYLRRESKLKPRFGVYWDNKLNAYCPSCKQLLSHNNLAHFHCNHCKTPILLKSDKGDESIAVSTAKEILKE